MLNADEEGQTHQELRGELNCGMTESRHQIDGRVLVNIRGKRIPSFDAPTRLRLKTLSQNTGVSPRPSKREFFAATAFDGFDTRP